VDYFPVSWWCRPPRCSNVSAEGDVPNGVIKVGHHGTWKLIANLSAFQAAHPVAHPDPADYDPDGTWYSMIAVGGALYRWTPTTVSSTRLPGAVPSAG